VDSVSPHETKRKKSINRMYLRDVLSHYNICRMRFKAALYFRPVDGRRNRQQDQAYITQAHVRFEVYSVKITVLCDGTRTNLVDNCQCFGETYCKRRKQ
jgi:hypothetical protein